MPHGLTETCAAPLVFPLASILHNPQRGKGQHCLVQAVQRLLDIASVVFDGGNALDQQPQGIEGPIKKGRATLMLLCLLT